MIEAAQHDSKQHLHHAQDHRHFHFERVDEGDFVGRQGPDGVQTERIRSTSVTKVQHRVQIETVAFFRLMSRPETRTGKNHPSPYKITTN